MKKIYLSLILVAGILSRLVSCSDDLLDILLQQDIRYKLSRAQEILTHLEHFHWEIIM